MDKQDINNEIVRLRSALKKCRVRTIRKMLAQIRNFRQAKGTEEQRKKNLQKAERWYQQVRHLKKVDLSAIAKEAFISEACWSSVISDANTSLERRAEARLINEKSARNIMTDFRKRNPTWMSWVPQIVEMWDRRQQFRAECNAGADTKASDKEQGSEEDEGDYEEDVGEAPSPKKDSRKRTSSGTERCTLYQSSSIGEEDSAEPPSKKPAQKKAVAKSSKDKKMMKPVVKPIQGKEKKIAKTKMKEQTSKTTPLADASQQDEDDEVSSSSIGSDSDESVSEKAEELSVTKKPSKIASATLLVAKKTSKPAKAKSHLKPIAKADAKVGRSKVVVPFNLSQFEADDELRLASDGEETDSKAGRSSESDIEETRPQPPKKKDSFFRGPDDTDDEDSSFQRGGFRNQGSRGFGRGSFRGRGGVKFSDTANFSPVGGGRGKSFVGASFDGGRGRGRGERGRGFRGRGNRAGGDRFGGSMPKDHHPQRERGDFRKEAEPKHNMKTEESLHPSWAAKKQQHAGIAQFKGKKIVFD